MIDTTLALCRNCIVRCRNFRFHHRNCIFHLRNRVSVSQLYLSASQSDHPLRITQFFIFPFLIPCVLHATTCIENHANALSVTFCHRLCHHLSSLKLAAVYVPVLFCYCWKYILVCCMLKRNASIILIILLALLLIALVIWLFDKRMEDINKMMHPVQGIILRPFSFHHS